jgi:hypothetical protein
MKHKDDDNIGLLLRKYGTIETSHKFTNDLVEVIIKQQQAKAVKQNSSRDWLAFSIIGMAVVLNLVFLFYTNPFSINPALYISVSCFILGMWGLIIICQKHLALKIGSV